MVERTSTVAAGRCVANRMSMRMLVDDDFTMAVFFPLVGMLRRHHGTQSQNDGKSQREAPAEQHCRGS